MAGVEVIARLTNERISEEDLREVLQELQQEVDDAGSNLVVRLST